MRAGALVVVAAAVLSACGGDAPNGEAAAREDTVIAMPDFAANPAGYEGRLITLENVQVASRLGEHAFWIQFPNEKPYLVKLDSTLSGMAVHSGESYTVTGTVHAMSDSVLSAWAGNGTIKDEGEKAEAQFATSFLEARQAVAGASAADSSSR